MHSLLTHTLNIIINTDTTDRHVHVCHHLSTSGAVVQCVRKLKTSTWWDEHLTGDNVEFLKREVTEEYSELTAAKLNPLKDEPWPRHQWEERESRSSS